MYKRSMSDSDRIDALENELESMRRKLNKMVDFFNDHTHNIQVEMSEYGRNPPIEGESPSKQMTFEF